MGTSEAQYDEKRKYPRYSCDLGVEIRVADAKTGYWGTLADICLGGCYVTTFSPLRVGTAVVLALNSKNLELTIAGKVVTFHPGVGMGIEFAGFIQPNSELDLKALLNELDLGANQQIG